MKQTAKQRYYQKNKELYKERVRQQREEKKAMPPPPPIQNTMITKEINDIPIQNKLKTEHTNEINKYIDGIKRFFKVGERYAMEIPLAKLNIPIFFYIKEINEENIIIDYVKIDFLKIGTGEATIAPLWDEIKEKRTINNKDIINIFFNKSHIKSYVTLHN